MDFGEILGNGPNGAWSRAATQHGGKLRVLVTRLDGVLRFVWCVLKLKS